MAISLEGMDAQAINDLAATAKSLLENPKTRRHALALTKMANPEISIPEIDIPQEVNGILTKAGARLEAVEKQIQEAEIKRSIMDRRAELMDKHGLSKDEIVEVEKLMVDKQIASHDTAAEFLKSQKQSAKPTPSGYMTNTMPKMDLKPFGGNLAQWSRQTAADTIDQIRSGRIAV